MNKLFAVLLGGKAKGANVEVHDVVFAVAPTIEEAAPQLKEKWFGDKGSVHMDSWMELNYCDGYKVEVVKNRTENSQQLYFVNIGSYPLKRLEEAHTYLFLAGTDPNEVKSRARKMGPEGHHLPHKDNLALVDDFIQVDWVGAYQIQLTKHDGPAPENPHFSDYRPLK